MSVDLTARWMRDGSCVKRPDVPWTTDIDRLRPVQPALPGLTLGGAA